MGDTSGAALATACAAMKAGARVVIAAVIARQEKEKEKENAKAGQLAYRPSA